MRPGGLNLRANVVGPFGALVNPLLDQGNLTLREHAAHGHSRHISNPGDSLI